MVEGSRNGLVYSDVGSIMNFTIDNTVNVTKWDGSGDLMCPGCLGILKFEMLLSNQDSGLISNQYQYESRHEEF
jgi:hypothetical protein